MALAISTDVEEHAPGVAGRRAIAQINGGAKGFERVVIAALDLAQSLSKLLGLLGNDFFEMVTVVFDFLFQALHAPRAREAG